jgi:membrane glycosyltransferase
MAVLLMADLLWRTGFTAWKVVFLLLFVVLFANIAFGFAQALLGFHFRMKGGDFCRIMRSVEWDTDEDLPLASTAIVMPICNEEVGRVFEGVRSVFESLKATRLVEPFEFFVLSDSGEVNKWIEEEATWVAMGKQLDAQGKLFYRKRRVNINRKSGNLADFCRRWGKRYRYMIVLDADSIMSGKSLVKMVQMMEKNPGVGIIQTVPRLVNGRTLFARMQQFSSRLYGPIFQTGLNYWQQGEGNYWGHNAIIRLAPFIEHCALPDLPGNEPFGGKILSHDYVEAALMRKGGWSVWLAYDLDGSYEEGPPNLIEFAKRDRRWSQGNLQHSWLLAASGLKLVSRIHLFLGALAYVASPLWLLFLISTTAMVYNFESMGLSFIATDSSMKMVRMDAGAQSALLFGITLFLLFFPKILCLLDLVRKPDEVARFGGWLRLLTSVVLENIASIFIAPVLMLFHSKFVLFTIFGKGVRWTAQRRGGEGGVHWREAFLTHYGHTMTGLLWGAAAYWISPVFFYWMSPVLLGMLFSIPLSYLTGKFGLGDKARGSGLFMTPEESDMPEELASLEKNLQKRAASLRPRLRPELADDYGLMQAVLDPYVNAIHVSLIREKTGSPIDLNNPLQILRERLLSKGPDALSGREKRSLLMDADSMIWLHNHLWSRPSRMLSEWWQSAISHYNSLSVAPQTALFH